MDDNTVISDNETNWRGLNSLLTTQLRTNGTQPETNTRCTHYSSHLSKIVALDLCVVKSIGPPRISIETRIRDKMWNVYAQFDPSTKLTRCTMPCSFYFLMSSQLNWFNGYPYMNCKRLVKYYHFPSFLPSIHEKTLIICLSLLLSILLSLYSSQVVLMRLVLLLQIFSVNMGKLNQLYI